MSNCRFCKLRPGEPRVLSKDYKLFSEFTNDPHYDASLKQELKDVYTLMMEEVLNSSNIKDNGFIEKAANELLQKVRAILKQHHVENDADLLIILINNLQDIFDLLRSNLQAGDIFEPLIEEEQR